MIFGIYLLGIIQHSSLTYWYNDIVRNQDREGLEQSKPKIY
jgi:hypothetical protein